MNKLLLFLSFLFFSGISHAQDSLARAEPPKISTVKYTEKDIQIDSSTVEAKTFSKNFKKKNILILISYTNKKLLKKVYGKALLNGLPVFTVVFLASQIPKPLWILSRSF
jgi:hypothetical protein